MSTNDVGFLALRKEGGLRQGQIFSWRTERAFLMHVASASFKLNRKL